jgi:asparagine synthase (glutamine-hydrolysing)
VCGLAGILSFKGAPPAAADLESMIRPLHHRGPDDTQVFIQGAVGLAHARLSIIDIAGGRQPVHNEDESVWTVFNGEIFNYLELREELEAKGHTFYTRSDTEVIVHAYEQYGLDFVHRFNGQFAIALWDRNRRRLVLARDRVGVRPIFYQRSNDRLIFASEIKGLFALPGVERRLDRRALAQVFHFWSPLEPATLFEGVNAVPPGHLVVAEAGDHNGGEITVRRFWDWSFPTENIPFDRPIKEYADELRNLLIDAVRLRLRSDVPVGAYLSGGLDSSIITTIIKNYTDTPLRTFSLGFEDEEFDESGYQQELVKHLGTNHTAMTCTRGDIGAAFPRTIWHTETTILRTAPTPLLLLSGRVHEEGYKVVLTGEGADEVFGGYDLFKEAQIRRFWARRPDSRSRAALLTRLYPYLKNSPAAAPAYAENFFRQGMDRIAEPFFGHLPRWSTTSRTWRFFSSELLASLEGWDPIEQYRQQLPADIGRWHPFNRDQYNEGHTLLSGYLLSSQGDRVGMANSVEGRFPFLDYRLMELAARLPILCKMMGLKEKHLLKRAMADLLPPAITRRTKQPYRAPDSQSFFEDDAPLPYVADLLSESRLEQAGYFEPAAVTRLTNKCRAGRAIGFADNMAFVGILSTMLVDEMYIRQVGTSTVEPSKGSTPPAGSAGRQSPPSQRE